MSKEIEAFIKEHNIPSEKTPWGDLEGIRFPIYTSDDDGFSYLNWLHWLTEREVIKETGGPPIFEGLKPDLHWINWIKDVIRKQLTSLQEKPEVLIKWLWMANYFNRQMLKQGLPEHQIDIGSIS